MILDVGCGASPQGDVNCDLYRSNKSPHEDNRLGKERKEIKNFVQCDAQYLPFREKTFGIVYSSHCLEHCEYPLDVLREFKRVARKIVFLRIPNVKEVPEQHPLHLYSWDCETFENLLGRVFSKVMVYCSYRKVKDGRFMKKNKFLRCFVNMAFKTFRLELIAVCEV